MVFKRFAAAGQYFDANDEIYTPSVLLGHGTYGAVCRATVLRDYGSLRAGQQVAIKKYRLPTEFKSDVHDIVAKRMFREIAILAAVRHKNLVRLFDLYTFHPHDQDLPDVYVVISFMEMDIKKIIFAPTAGDGAIPFGISHAQYVLYQMLCGLDALHKYGVLHRDLTPTNVLINTEASVKLCDFGLSALSTPEALRSEKDPKMTQYVISRSYRPPEIAFACQHHAEPVDVWSAGCIFVEMLLRRNFFVHRPEQDTIDQLWQIICLFGTPAVSDIPPNPSKKAWDLFLTMPQMPHVDIDTYLPPETPEQARDLLKRMLSFNPATRISVHDALRHPFFANSMSSQEGLSLFDKEDLLPSSTPRIVIPEFDSMEAHIDAILEMERTRSWERKPQQQESPSADGQEQGMMESDSSQGEDYETSSPIEAEIDPDHQLSFVGFSPAPQKN